VRVKEAAVAFYVQHRQWRPCGDNSCVIGLQFCLERGEIGLLFLVVFFSDGFA
jgi:hypothetical protein